MQRNADALANKTENITAEHAIAESIQGSNHLAIGHRCHAFYAAE